VAGVSGTVDRTRNAKLARLAEADYERRYADAELVTARKAKLSDEELLPLARRRLDAWREWGEALGPAVPGGNPKGRRTSESDRQSESEYKDRERARKISAVDGDDFETYKAGEEPDKLTLAGCIRLLPRPESETPPMKDGEYRVLYVDPPWRYDGVETPDARQIENHYPTMALDELKALKDKIPAADDSIMFMWATSPKLTEAMDLLAEWGFNYRTCMVWVKDKIGMGYYARQQHELLLIARRGNPGVPDPAARPASVIEAPRGAHSAKPHEFYDVLEAMYPDASRVELFARNEREGWASWGNEVAQAA